MQEHVSVVDAERKCYRRNIMESNKTSFKKICRKCGKELPSDSAFCQYCGNSDIDAVSIVKVKVCGVCGKELPSDSMF